MNRGSKRRLSSSASFWPAPSIRRGDADRIALLTTAWPTAPADRAIVLHTRVVTGAGGGPDKTILLSPRWLANERYWVAAALFHPPHDRRFDVLRARAATVSCPLIGLADRGPLDLRLVRDLLSLCRHLRVNIWHAHDYKSNLIGLLLRPFHQMQLVTTVHGWVQHTARTRLYFPIDRFCLKRYDRVICVSDDLLGRARGLGLDEEQCVLLRNAVDETEFRRAYGQSASPLRAKYQVPPDRAVVGAIGRLSPEKGFAVLLAAMASLVADGLDFELWIAGEGERRAFLERLVETNGLRQRVRFLGYLPDLIELYHALDLFVLSSVREGLPNVLLEAMALEVPVVATSVAGVPGLVQDGRTGILCPPGDPYKLARAIYRLLGDVALRKRLAAAGRALIESQYTLRQRMTQERALYDQLLGARAWRPVGNDDHTMPAA